MNEIRQGTILQCTYSLPNFIKDLYYEVKDVVNYKSMGTEVIIIDCNGNTVTFQTKDPNGKMFLGTYFNINTNPLSIGTVSDTNSVKMPRYVESKHAEWIKNTITAFLGNYEHLSQQEREVIIKFIQSLENPKLIIPNND